jgi:hypothetical protein
MGLVRQRFAEELGTDSAFRAKFYGPSGEEIRGNVTLLDAGVQDGDLLTYVLPDDDEFDESLFKTNEVVAVDGADGGGGGSGGGGGGGDGKGKARSKEKGFVTSRLGGGGGGAAPGAAVAAGTSWACGACTFANKAESRKCEVCNAGR